MLQVEYNYAHIHDKVKVDKFIFLKETYYILLTPSVGVGGAPQEFEGTSS